MYAPPFMSPRGILQKRIKVVNSLRLLEYTKKFTYPFKKKVEKYTFEDILYFKHKRTDTCYMQASVLYKNCHFSFYKINISPLNPL